MAQNEHYQNVDTYITLAPIEAQPILNELRFIVRSTVPEAEETINWNVPYYKYHGELVGFDAAKKHVSFGFGSNVLEDKDRKTLEESGYKLGKQTLQIKFNQKVPSTIIKRILRSKAKMNKKK